MTNIDMSTELRHLLRAVKTALELAIVTGAPAELVNRLAGPAGLLEALSQLPLEGTASGAMLPELLIEARSAVDRWEAWLKVRGAAA